MVIGGAHAAVTQTPAHVVHHVEDRHESDFAPPGALTNPGTKWASALLGRRIALLIARLMALPAMETEVCPANVDIPTTNPG